MSGELVVGYDGSEGSKAALTEAIGFAKKLGTELVIAFAYEPPSPAGGEMSDLRAALHDIGHERTHEALTQAHEAGADARVVLVDDRPAEGLATLAEELDACMVVVGSYGRRPLRSAILGSTPHKLLHNTRVPVLVVRAPDQRG